MSKLLSTLAAVTLLFATLALAPPNVEIKNDAFAPATLTITAGETVTFTNDDDDAHTVTETEGAFDSKGLDTNGRWRHTFAKPGTYTYFCQLHPFMKGTIVVKPVSQ
jgi:plastocyanin